MQDVYGINLGTEMGTTTMTETPIFDPKEVDEVVKEPSITQGYPKYQVSKFFGEGYQVVVRTETFQELLETMKNVKVLVAAAPSKDQPVEPKKDVYEKSQSTDLGMCKNCGAPRVRNPNKGTTFCSAKCWLKDK